MRSLKLTIAALATIMAFGTAGAKEEMELIVVKAERPIEHQAPEFVAIEEPTPEIDFTKIPIEAPTIDRSDMELTPKRFELATHDTSETRT